MFRHLEDIAEADAENLVAAGAGIRVGMEKAGHLRNGRSVGEILECGDLRERKADRALITAAINAVGEVRLVEDVIDYIAALVRGTRANPELESGASPRAGAMLAGAARAHAALDGRDFVIPDDVKALAPALLRHRVILSPAAEINGRKVEEIVLGIIETIEAPR